MGVYLRTALVCLALAGCGLATPPPDAARVATGAFNSNGDPDTAAINLASWGFSFSSRLRGKPATAAQSIAAVDYLAGELSSSGRWLGISPLVPGQMLQARREVRAAIGVAPDAKSQLVVDSLLNYAAFETAGQPAQAYAALSNPAFTLGAAATEARLADLPFLTEANVATQRAYGAMQGDGSPDNQR